jgi:hypothetical protein
MRTGWDGQDLPVMMSACRSAAGTRRRGTTKACDSTAPSMGDDPVPEPRAVAAAFDLGDQVGRLEEVAGAWSNRVFRLEVDGRVYAVKQVLDPWQVEDWFERIDEAWRLERHAIAAGVSAPAPVPNPADGSWRADVECADGQELATVRVHHWVDGRPAPTTAAPEALARWCGATLATIHGLDLRPTRPEVFRARDEANVHRWPGIVEAVSRAGVPWAEAAVAASDPVRRTGELLRAGTEGAGCMSHRDIDQKNLLLAGSDPVLCDWDVAGPVATRAELADVALSMARWERPEIARTTLEAYRNAGGDTGAITPADVAPMLLSSIDWAVLNIERALGTGREQRLGAELAPTLLARLAPRLEIALDVDRFLAG